MQNRTFLQKITSRKFILCAVVIVIGVLLAFGVDATTLEKAIGSIVSAIAAVTFIFAETKIDVANLSSAATAVKEAIEDSKAVVDELKENEEIK